MKFIALIVFVVVQIVFIPLALIGVVLITFKQIVVSKRLGVSSTALSVLSGRWIMNAYGIRKDNNVARLYRSLPNASATGLWLLVFPSYLQFKINPSLPKNDKVGVFSVMSARTVHFDHLINKSLDKTEQFVVMGAGYDTRAYGFIPNKKIKFFELDQLKTQQLKMDSLKKAGIDSSHVTFVNVDFSTEKWYEKLEHAGYDPNKKSIFLWEGVTLYLSETDVRKTINEIKTHAAPGSVLITDFYGGRVLALKGVKSTNEWFNFGLDFSADYQSVLKTFLESIPAKLGDFYFMGYKHKKGPMGVVAEICL
jgi:methyltransferase (TIGR00027 family)